MIVSASFATRGVPAYIVQPFSTETVFRSAGKGFILPALPSQGIRFFSGSHGRHSSAYPK
jgi:hypothetical protein